jgi:hypothetical protein
MCWKVYSKKGDFIMVRTIDLKSALIGGFVVAMILFLAGAVPYLPSEEYGRFKIEMNDHYAFILDSATGQVWAAQTIGIGAPDSNFHAPKTPPHY